MIRWRGAGLVAIISGSLLVATLLPASVGAAPRDKRALEKIDEALQHHYEQRYDRAEAMLVAIVEACGDRCSHEVLAKAWMYVGIVRGSGRGDLAAAREAFLNAVTLDPHVELDELIASPPTREVWRETSAGTEPPGDAGPEATGAGPSRSVHPGPPVGDMHCSLRVREVEVRRAIPLSCSTDEDASRGDLRYRAPGGEWRRVRMRPHEEELVAEIPCDATDTPGELRLYVVARDDEEVVDRWGSRRSPVVVRLVPSSDSEPPSLPGRPAPERCAERVLCPPDFPCPCVGDQDCGSDEVCLDGVCQADVECHTDRDCPRGAACVSGECNRAASARIWVGADVAQDFAVVGGDDVCSRASREAGDFACFDESGAAYGGDPQAGIGGNIGSGLARATTRFLLSVDYTLEKVSFGARAGLAPLGAAPSDGGNGFLPIHAEARVAYWPGGTPRISGGVWPFLQLGAGVAQIDARVPVVIRDCGSGLETDPQGSTYAPDSAQYQRCVDPTQPSGPHRAKKLDAWRRLGRTFVTSGVGVHWSLGRFALRGSLSALALFPTTGVAVQPSLGIVWAP